ncbi:MAG: hypothetical protein WKG07_26750, partial [Hymenobacter sp.]
VLLWTIISEPRTGYSELRLTRFSGYTVWVNNYCRIVLLPHSFFAMKFQLLFVLLCSLVGPAWGKLRGLAP